MNWAFSEMHGHKHKQLYTKKSMTFTTTTVSMNKIAILPSVFPACPDGQQCAAQLDH